MHIKREAKKAMKQRQFIVNEQKCKERHGSIFFDQINKVLAAVQREKGVFDYLIEWKYNKKDDL